MTLKEIRESALKLDDNDRELLAVELLASLTSADSQSEIDAAWQVEILARSDRHRHNESEAIDANESLKRVRHRIQSENR